MLVSEVTNQRKRGDERRTAENNMQGRRIRNMTRRGERREKSEEYEE